MILTYIDSNGNKIEIDSTEVKVACRVCNGTGIVEEYYPPDREDFHYCEACHGEKTEDLEDILTFGSCFKNEE